MKNLAGSKSCSESRTVFSVIERRLMGKYRKIMCQENRQKQKLFGKAAKNK
jgi:hypothetical protein